MFRSRRLLLVPAVAFAALGGVHGCAAPSDSGFPDGGSSGDDSAAGSSRGTGSSSGYGSSSGNASSSGSSNGSSGAVGSGSGIDSGSNGGSGGIDSGGSSGSGSGGIDGGSSGGSGSGATDSGGTNSSDSGGIDSGNSSGIDSGGSGSGSSGGTDSGACSSSLIDNMENGRGAILQVCGRVGFWYTYHDATAAGTQTPAAGAMFTDSMIAPARGASTLAARTTGSGFTAYGAGMGFDLNNPGGTATKMPYNASMYSGVTFWVMGSAGGAVRFNVADKATDPSGGICMGTSGANQCNDHHGHPLTLTTSWQQVSFTWAQLTQQGFGYPEASLDTSHLVAMQFQIGAPTGSFDLWIDDIAFTP